MIIGIDYGDYAIKTASHTFQSGISEYKVIPNNGNDFLEYNGSFWMPSDQRRAGIGDSDISERIFAITLIAIAKELKSRGLSGITKVNLAVGLPLEHYAKLRKEVQEYLSRPEPISFKYMGDQFCISVGDVFILPEIYSAATGKIKLVDKSTRVFVIDIGGYTTRYLLILAGKPDSKYSGCLDMGVVPLFNSIIGKVNSRHNLTLSEDHIRAVLKGEPVELDKEVIAEIRESAHQYTNAILDALRGQYVDVALNPVIFVGGGAILLQRTIAASKMAGRSEFALNLNANAIEYERLAKAKQLKCDNRI